jgi:outer membrane protein TolC
VQPSGIGKLFASSATLWSLGASLAQTLFDAGARRTRVAQARAAYDVTVAPIAGR